MIKKDSVVSLSYILKNENGEELDRSESATPLAYMHGHGQIVPGLENVLEGLAIGDKKEVIVTPQEGYGEVQPQLKVKVSRDKFPADRKIEPGMQFSSKMEDGRRSPSPFRPLKAMMFCSMETTRLPEKHYIFLWK